jgi:X-Pro dipeptidyl-peptidase
MVLSSDRDFTLWPKPGTKLSVDLSATQITLPIVGGEKAYIAAVKK